MTDARETPPALDPPIAAPPIHEPWPIETEPTNLLASWPGADPPARGDVIAAVRRHFGDAARVLDDGPPAPPGVVWCIAVDRDDEAGPFVAWCEAARSAPVGGGIDVGAGRWVIGFETVLRGGDPMADYHDLMRFVAVGLEDVPAILDVNTTSWFTRGQMDELFADADLAPPDDVLWVIHAVRRDGPDGVAWLHTHGLWRCGRPELEMLEVPVDHADAAATLLNDVAALLLETPPPSPGVPVAIGADLAVVLQPWSVAASYVADDAPGGAHDRARDGDAHTGIRAVVCADTPVGTYRKLWTWPRAAIARLAGGDACVFQTKRATTRQTRLAQREWKRFAGAVAGAGAGAEDAARFYVKAAYAVAGDPSVREHLWYDVIDVREGRVEGRLVNEPHGDARRRRGDVTSIDLCDVTDWRVETERGVFGPEDARRMSMTLGLEGRRP